MTDDVCPVCSEEYNHIIGNGYRNTWPTGSEHRVAVCTDESTRMYVHVERVNHA